MMNFEEREKMLIELEEKNYYKDSNEISMIKN